MRPLVIVELEPIRQPRLQLRHAQVVLNMDILMFVRSSQPLNALPRPSMHTDTPADSSRPVNDLAVYCTPYRC
jgi:hypothetical protein